jgi:hypothetical protein
MPKFPTDAAGRSKIVDKEKIFQTDSKIADKYTVLKLQTYSM